MTINILQENSLYVDATTRAALIADKRLCMDALLINYFGFLGLFKINDSRGIIKKYETTEGKLFLNNIGDTNHDVSLAIKLAVEAGCLLQPAAMEMTKLLVLIKNKTVKGADLIEQNVKDLLKATMYHSHQPDAKILAIMDQFTAGTISLPLMAKELYIAAKAKHLQPITVEFRNIVMKGQYQELFAKIGPATAIPQNNTAANTAPTTPVQTAAQPVAQSAPPVAHMPGHLPAGSHISLPRITNTTPGHNKYWAGVVNNTDILYQYGALTSPASPSLKFKSYATQALANAALAALLKEKMRNGYVSDGVVNGIVPAVSQQAATPVQPNAPVTAVAPVATTTAPVAASPVASKPGATPEFYKELLETSHDVNGMNDCFKKYGVAKSTFDLIKFETWLKANIKTQSKFRLTDLLFKDMPLVKHLRSLSKYADVVDILKATWCENTIKHCLANLDLTPTPKLKEGLEEVVLMCKNSSIWSEASAGLPVFEVVRVAFLKRIEAIIHPLTTQPEIYSKCTEFMNWFTHIVQLYNIKSLTWAEDKWSAAQIKFWIGMESANSWVNYNEFPVIRLRNSVAYGSSVNLVSVLRSYLDTYDDSIVTLTDDAPVSKATRYMLSIPEGTFAKFPKDVQTVIKLFSDQKLRVRIMNDAEAKAAQRAKEEADLKVELMGYFHSGGATVGGSMNVSHIKAIESRSDAEILKLMSNDDMRDSIGYRLYYYTNRHQGAIEAAMGKLSPNDAKVWRAAIDFLLSQDQSYMQKTDRGVEIATFFAKNAEEGGYRHADCKDFVVKVAIHTDKIKDAALHPYGSRMMYLAKYLAANVPQCVDVHCHYAMCMMTEGSKFDHEMPVMSRDDFLSVAKVGSDYIYNISSYEPLTVFFKTVKKSFDAWADSIFGSVSTDPNRYVLQSVIPFLIEGASRLGDAEFNKMLGDLRLFAEDMIGDSLVNTIRKINPAHARLLASRPKVDAKLSAATKIRMIDKTDIIPMLNDGRLENTIKNSTMNLDTLTSICEMLDIIPDNDSKPFIKIIKIAEILFENKGLFDKSDRENAISKIIHSLLKMHDSNKKAAEEVYADLNGDIKRNLIDQLAGDAFMKVIKPSITDPSVLIRPLQDLTDARIDEMLAYNKVSIPAIRINSPAAKNISALRDAVKDHSKHVAHPKVVRHDDIGKNPTREEYLLKKSVEYDRFNRYKHGGIAIKFLDEFNVNIPEQVSGYNKFLASNAGTTVMNPVFHGTGSIAASMILRFGFAIISSKDSSVTGRMLGDGIYFSTVLDKVAQYVGDKGFGRQIGTKGYIFQMTAALGEINKHYRTATSNVVSPEWCVKSINQVKIEKAFLIELITKDTMQALKKKYPLSESVAMPITTFREFLKESQTEGFEECTSYIFLDGMIPVSATERVDFESLDMSRFPPNVHLDSSAYGPMIIIDHNLGETNTLYVDNTAAFMSDKAQMLTYLDLLYHSNDASVKVTES